MYRLNLQQIMQDSNVFNLTTVREQLKKDYDITDAEYFKCLDGQNIEFFDNLKIPSELLELMKHKHEDIFFTAVVIFTGTIIVLNIIALIFKMFI